uniref:Ig-like domain-containing protein n=1 Tax=Mola mola TaxID=94237 RepID=A0A3Q3WUI9_MOLML
SGQDYNIFKTHCGLKRFDNGQFFDNHQLTSHTDEFPLLLFANLNHNPTFLRVLNSISEFDHTLGIMRLEADDGGLYVCKVSNNAGSAECSMELQIVVRPNFVKPLGLTAAVVGAPLHLECQVDEDTGVSVTWTRDGRKVHQSPNCKLSFDNKKVSLDILKTTLKDCGNYVCTVVNEAGSTSCSTLVKVQGKRLFFYCFCQAFMYHVSHSHQ